MKQVLMIAYTIYPSDARVRREAETVAALPGHVVTVLTVKEEEKPRVFELGNVRVRELDIRKYQGKGQARRLLSYLRFTLLAFIECTKQTARKSLDILHVHNMPNFLIFAGLVPLLSGRPIILDIHDTVLETYAAQFGGSPGKIFQWVLRAEEAFCCRLAHRIVCVNDIQKAALARRHIPERKMVVAMNLPDPRIFDHTRPIQVRPKREGTFRMIYHGTVTKRVGIDLAIRAVAELNGLVPGIELHIVGDGDSLEELRTLGGAVGAGEAVRFRGRVPLDGMIPVLKGMDLGIVPNGRNVATELMLPVKMLECMALGIPVVAPRLTTITHYFTKEMVFFFEPEDMSSLVEAIRQAYRSEDARLAKAREARRFLEKNGWDTHKRKFLEMYRSLGNRA